MVDFPLLFATFSFVRGTREERNKHSFAIPEVILRGKKDKSSLQRSWRTGQKRSSHLICFCCNTYHIQATVPEWSVHKHYINGIF